MATAVALAAVVLVTAALWWWSSPVEVEDDANAVALVAWRAPTDILLETPGRSLLVEVPTLGGDLLPPAGLGRPKKNSAGSPSGRKENTS